MGKGGLPSDVLICDICGGKYTRANKVPHNKTKQHQQALKYEKIIKNTLQQQLPHHTSIEDRVENIYYDTNGDKVRLTKKKADFYNSISEAKNGHKCYFKSQDEIDEIFKKYKNNDIEETSSDEDVNDKIAEAYNSGRMDFSKQLKTAFRSIQGKYDAPVSYDIIYKLLDPYLNDIQRKYIINGLEYRE